MNQLDHIEVLDDESPTFYAPVSSDLIDQLVSQYRAARDRIEHIGAFVSEQINSSVMHYFIEGNHDDDNGRNRMTTSAANLFDVGGAVAALNAAYWSKALQLTDVLDAMPQKRRNEWHESIRNPKGKRASRQKRWNDDELVKEWEIEPLPDFTEETARATLTSMLGMRAQFMGERVDGIFQGLSGGHVTNAPEGFGKRMILARALSSYGTCEHSTFGLINDLRCVVAKFMGRDEPKFNATDKLCDILKRNWGEWMSVDGGAVRIRLYRKGTAHLEVHPDMAWRLNSILASLHPLAIPAEFRQKPKRKAKDFKMIGRPLPFAVLAVLSAMTPARDWYEQGHQKYARDIPRTRTFGYNDEADKNIRRQAEDVLRAIGGVEMPYGKGASKLWQFDYEVSPVMDQVITSGCIPDVVAHQFYPSPERVALAAIELADIGPTDTCLEPSAGLGGLADHMPKDRTTCVEIAPLHCRILEGKGYAVHEGDFVAWADRVPRQQFDRVILNPPFADGRAKLHTERAYDLLKPGGVLVAILPASFNGKPFLSGVTEWSRVYDNEFSGTTVSVVLMKTTRPAMG